MFSNLQNKIDLKKIREDNVDIDRNFTANENFDTVNQTASYFKMKKNKINDIIIKEDVIEFEDEKEFSELERMVGDEQSFIYNDDNSLEDIKKIISDEEEDIDGITESYAKYFKHKSAVIELLEHSNDNLKMELDSYRMAHGDYESFSNSGYDVESLFDIHVIELARDEYLDQIHTINWLEKQLIAQRKVMADTIANSREFQIKNELKKLDVNDTEEIKNKIRNLQESVIFLKEM